MNGASYQNNFNNFNANGILIELPKKAAPKKANAPKKAGFFAGRLA
jgi:hypothetical protein